MWKSGVCAVSIRCTTQQSNIHWWPSSNAATECVGSSLQQVRTIIMAKNCCLLSCNISSVVRLMLVDHSLQVWGGASCQPPVCLPYMPDGDRKMWETAEIRARHVCQGKPSNHTLMYYESSQRVCVRVCVFVKIKEDQVVYWFLRMIKIGSLLWQDCSQTGITARENELVSCPLSSFILTEPFPLLSAGCSSPCSLLLPVLSA